MKIRIQADRVSDVVQFSLNVIPSWSISPAEGCRGSLGTFFASTNPTHEGSVPRAWNTLQKDPTFKCTSNVMWKHQWVDLTVVNIGMTYSNPFSKKIHQNYHVFFPCLYNYLYYQDLESQDLEFCFPRHGMWRVSHCKITNFLWLIYRQNTVNSCCHGCGVGFSSHSLLFRKHNILQGMCWCPSLWTYAKEKNALFIFNFF